jgi:uncharacterized protein YjaZ
MQNYKKLMNQIRKKSFPEIKGKIFIYRIGLLFGLAGTLSLPFHLNFIFITPKLNNKSKKYIKGILAHELSHISRNQELTFFKALIICDILHALKCVASIRLQ